MRLFLVLLATTSLAACGGGGPQTIGGTAVQGGAAAGGAPSSGHTFVNPTEQKTYATIGGVQRYEYSTDDRNIRGQYGQLYAGDATTARNSGITVDYNPRDAIFNVVINSQNSGINQTFRFQDPLHRTDFGGLREPQGGTPRIDGRGINYLESGAGTAPLSFDPAQSDFVPVGDAGGSTTAQTFFYQRPGTTTNFVTYAGYLRNNTSVVEVTDTTSPTGATYLRQNNILERGVFVYGERSSSNVVPRTGSGTFSGEMLATMIFNPLADTLGTDATYFQWITGNSTTRVDFAANTFSLDLTGTVFAPQFDVFTNRSAALQAGATFTATGSGRVDLVNAGGFLGAINSARFVNPGAGGQTFNLTIAGSSVDGAFFGPAAQEVGGGFRIVGGVPDERIDILGAFTGKR